MVSLCLTSSFSPLHAACPLSNIRLLYFTHGKDRDWKAGGWMGMGNMCLSHHVSSLAASWWCCHFSRLALSPVSMSQHGISVISSSMAAGMPCHANIAGVIASANLSSVSVFSSSHVSAACLSSPPLHACLYSSPCLAAAAAWQPRASGSSLLSSQHMLCEPNKPVNSMSFSII